MDQIRQSVIFADEFLQKNPLVRKRLIELFGEESKDSIFWRRFACEIIECISKNMELFTKYYRGRFDKYFDVNAAIDNAEDRGGVLTFFTDLNLYARVDSLVDFKDFIGGVRDLAEDNENFHLGLNQIILSDKKQKLVFVCSDNSNDIAAKIQKYIRDHLGADPLISRTTNSLQITIGDHYTFDESLIKFNSIHEYVRSRDGELAKLLSVLPRLGDKKYKYTNPDIGDCINVHSVDELIKIFKFLPAGANIQQMNINFGGNLITGNNNTITNLDGGAIATEWIKNNPPTVREITSDYYSRYAKENKNPVSNAQLGKLLHAAGFRTRNAGKYRYLVKE